jgi:hypothetical protein
MCGKIQVFCRTAGYDLLEIVVHSSLAGDKMDAYFAASHLFCRHVR